jgi:hypothetical protein
LSDPLERLRICVTDQRSNLSEPDDPSDIGLEHSRIRDAGRVRPKDNVMVRGQLEMRVPQEHLDRLASSINS